MSAFPPIATELRTSLVVRFVPKSRHSALRKETLLFDYLVVGDKQRLRGG